MFFFLVEISKVIFLRRHPWVSGVRWKSDLEPKVKISKGDIQYSAWGRSFLLLLVVGFSCSVTIRKDYSLKNRTVRVQAPVSAGTPSLLLCLKANHWSSLCVLQAAEPDLRPPPWRKKKTKNPDRNFSYLESGDQTNDLGPQTSPKKWTPSGCLRTSKSKDWVIYPVVWWADGRFEDICRQKRSRVAAAPAPQGGWQPIGSLQYI